MSALATQLVTDPNNRVFVSPASYWEIAIEIKTAKLVLRESFLDFVQHALYDNGFTILPIEQHHAAIVATLPLHHKDPFDRLLIAQSLADAMPLISVDAAADPYGVLRPW